jgi:hypothetical protein
MKESKIIPAILLAVLLMFSFNAGEKKSGKRQIRMLENTKVISLQTPDFHNAVYVEKRGSRLLSGNRISEDNGKTWNDYLYKPDFNSELPHGYRREKTTSVLDPNTGRLVTIINSLDTPGLDPDIIEPPVAQYTYYLRYMVSEDGARSWLYDEPIIQKGNFTAENPFEGINIGQNSIYLGDIGSIPVVTKQGYILVPAQTTLAGSDGKLFNPGGGFTYTDVLILIGSWKDDGKLSWNISERVQADPARSTRGLIEPTLAELNDGRILMIMRGSNGGKNDPQYSLPGYKWYSVSDDGGFTWTEAEPLKFDDGMPFFSPSAMSTLFMHSGGRCFWVGNISSENVQGNLPRWPLVIAEINTRSLRLIRSGMITIDTRTEADLDRGRLDLSHFAMLEDRQTGEIILTYPRSYNSYKSAEWVTVRFAVK